MRSHNTRMQRTVHRIGAVALAGNLVLAGCAPAGRAEACSAVDSFSRYLRPGINNLELAFIASRLSEDLFAIAPHVRNESLGWRIRHTAISAEELTASIESGQSVDDIVLEIETLMLSIDTLRMSC